MFNIFSCRCNGRILYAPTGRCPKRRVRSAREMEEAIKTHKNSSQSVKKAKKLEESDSDYDDTWVPKKRFPNKHKKSLSLPIIEPEPKEEKSHQNDQILLEPPQDGNEVCVEQLPEQEQEFITFCQPENDFEWFLYNN